MQPGSPGLRRLSSSPGFMQGPFWRCRIAGMKPLRAVVLHGAAEAHAKARIEHSAAGRALGEFLSHLGSSSASFPERFLFPKKHSIFLRLSLRYFARVRLRHMKLSHKLT
jgi:hypothetical protein